MLRKGASYEEVAAEFGVKRDTIYRLAKRRNVAEGRKRTYGPKVTFRLTEEEMAGFEKLASENGFQSKSDLARALVRKASGFLDVDGSELAELKRISEELGRIGNNVNQLAAAYNMKRYEVVAMNWSDIEEAEKALRRFQLRLDDVVAEVQRRGARVWRKSEFGS